jgi:hypothetical protein
MSHDLVTRRAAVTNGRANLLLLSSFPPISRAVQAQQQSTRVRRIGCLIGGSAAAGASARRSDAFRATLAELRPGEVTQ